MQHVGRLGVLPRRARRRLRPQVRAAVGLDRGGVQLRLIPGQSDFPQSKKIQGWPMQLWPLFENDELLKHPCSVAFANGTSQDALDENRGLF